MRISLLLIYCFSSSFAWLPPERCVQSNRLQRTLTVAATKNASVEPNIEEIADNQNALLKRTYQNYHFPGVPIRAGCAPNVPNYIYAPYNCTFHTYGPRLLSSVACHNAGCKLTHTVSTMDTYTSSEGYNWGVKISSKASFFEKTFEVGGEVSTGGTYTCSYSRGKTTSDTVECSEATGKTGHIQLYNVKSDMQCDFGRITLEEDPRDNRRYGVSRMDYFTRSELDEIADSAATRFEPCSEIMIDTNKISDRLFQKILKEIPRYNPFTDMVSVNYPHTITVYYLKKTANVKDYSKIIPFTNEGGDSVFQYACLLTPF